MDDKAVIQTYINNFRRRITSLLKPDIGLACNVFSTEKGGAILEFKIAPGIKNEDIYINTSASVQSALINIEQHAFGGNLNGFTFNGTNVVMEQDRIIIIKDDTLKEWSDSAAEYDIQRIIPDSNRIKK